MNMYCESIPYCFDFDSDISELVNQFYGNNSTEFTETRGTETIPCKQSSVLDDENGESANKASEKIITNGAPEKKSPAALKSHSEAERRRRERINGHLAALRDFVPNSEKMEKAALLAEVINQVKHLRTKAKLASQGLNIPTDADELEVEELNNHGENASFVLRASLCCAYRTELLSDVRQAMNNLPIQILKSEVSTLRGRVKIVFLITSSESNNGAAGKEVIASRVKTAFGKILDKVSAEAEFDQELVFPQKRRRVSSAESTCLS